MCCYVLQNTVLHKPMYISGMAGCLDNFQLPQWECCDVGEKRNAIASIIGGSMASVFKIWLNDSKKPHGSLNNTFRAT